MAVTEFVFPHPKPDPSLQQELEGKLPAAVQSTFSGVSGLFVLYIARILKSETISPNTADGRVQNEHSGACLLLEWDALSSFDAFVASSKLAAFKATLTPYLLGPPPPEVYNPLSAARRSIGATGAGYTQVVRVTLSSPDEKEAVERTWESLTGVLQLAPAGDEERTFYAWGVRNVDGVFLGLIGWESLSALESANESGAVKEQLWSLTKYGSVSVLIIQAQKQP